MTPADFPSYLLTSSFWGRPESRQHSCLAQLQKVTLAELTLAWIPASAGMTKLNNIA